MPASQLKVELLEFFKDKDLPLGPEDLATARCLYRDWKMSEAAEICVDEILDQENALWLEQARRSLT